MAERYDALTVREKDGKSYFTKIGAMFKNRQGEGFTLMLDAVPASNEGQYRILLSVPKPREDRQQGATQQVASRSSYADLDDDEIGF